jgi:L-fuconolactonase
MTLINRRDFLQTSAATVGALAISTDLFADEKKKKKKEKLAICDTHLHLWDLTKFKLPWLAGEGVQSINKSYVMSDYRKATKKSNVTRAVYMEVNVHADHQVKEAEYVLALCKDKSNPMQGATIGGSPQNAAFAKYIERFADEPYIKGVRTVLHDDNRPKGMCLEPTFVKNIQLLGEMGRRWDLCMRPGELTDGAKLVDQCPKTKFVVDHCGNLSVQNKDAKLRSAWEKGIKELAQRPNVICKISGIIASADKESWTYKDLEPNVNFCMDTFGEDRIIFAGDWPVCTLTAPFGGWVGALKKIVKKRSESFQRKLFHDNAVKFYELS